MTSIRKFSNIKQLKIKTVTTDFPNFLETYVFIIWQPHE